MYSYLGTRLRSLVRSRRSNRVRAVWRVLVPILAGYLAVQLSGATAHVLGVSEGTRMLVAFGGTTVVTIGVLGVSARHLDRRPVSDYGFDVSRDWWLDLLAGAALGTAVVATAFAIARGAGALRVTGSASLPDAATFGRLLAFLVAFVGVAFYEEFIYRGCFLTNAIEGLSDRGYARPVAPVVALVASSVAFALVHLPSAIVADANLALVAAKTALLGGLFGVAYLLTGELALPMGLHLGVNYALLNVFGIGSEELTGVPSVLAVESTTAGLWSPSRGLPILGATLAGYVLVVAWIRLRRGDLAIRSVDPRARARSGGSER